MGALTREEFEQYLRDSLSYLYDPDHLRVAPLARLLGVSGRADTPNVFRRILTQAIESLEPPADVPPNSRAWRIYNALLYLYVQQMNQEEAADKMALSARQVRRDRTAGVRALADLLWERYGLTERQALNETPKMSPPVREELAWLQHKVPGTSADLRQVLDGILDLTKSLASRQRTRLNVMLPEDLARVAAPAVALRQILLGILSAGMHEATDKVVTLVARMADGKVEICVRGLSAPADDTMAGLDTVRQLVELCQGSVAFSDRAGERIALVTLPASDRVPVLVIDDNADTLQLLQRYTADTRYELITTTDPDEAIELAE